MSSRYQMRHADLIARALDDGNGDRGDVAPPADHMPRSLASRCALCGKDMSENDASADGERCAACDREMAERQMGGPGSGPHPGQGKAAAPSRYAHLPAGAPLPADATPSERYEHQAKSNVASQKAGRISGKGVAPKGGQFAERKLGGAWNHGPVGPGQIREHGSEAKEIGRSVHGNAVVVRRESPAGARTLNVYHNGDFHSSHMDTNAGRSNAADTVGKLTGSRPDAKAIGEGAAKHSETPSKESADHPINPLDIKPPKGTAPAPTQSIGAIKAGGSI